MNATNPADQVAWMLLIAHLLALSVACVIFGWMFFLHRRALHPPKTPDRIPNYIFNSPDSIRRPTSWLAIRSATPEAVKSALGLTHSAPCSWSDGMAEAHEFFISPQIHGWVIVTGMALPTPDDDVDACFLFLVALSRKLGHIQFFHAEKFSKNHAWARLDDGCVTRAYSWSGETIWNQGSKTMPEIELGLKCFDYGDDSATKQIADINFEKIPSLAARWSFDPAAIDEHLLNQSNGTAGEFSRLQ